MTIKSWEFIFICQHGLCVCHWGYMYICVKKHVRLCVEKYICVHTHLYNTCSDTGVWVIPQ